MVSSSKITECVRKDRDQATFQICRRGDQVALAWQSRVPTFVHRVISEPIFRKPASPRLQGAERLNQATTSDSC